MKKPKDLVQLYSERSPRAIMLRKEIIHLIYPELRVPGSVQVVFGHTSHTAWADRPVAEYLAKAYSDIKIINPMPTDQTPPQIPDGDTNKDIPVVTEEHPIVQATPKRKYKYATWVWGRLVGEARKRKIYRVGISREELVKLLEEMDANDQGTAT